MAFFVYILASQRNGTLYTGMTDGLAGRVSQHKQKLRGDGFTAHYGVDLLVWYEVHDTREGAFRRERQIKKWNREIQSRMARSVRSDRLTAVPSGQNWVPAFAGMSGI